MFESMLEVARQSVQQAAEVCGRIQRQVTPEMVQKKDRSPVTVADFASQAVVSIVLQEAFPDIPMVGEEDTATLTEVGHESLKQRVLEEVNRTLGRDLLEHEILAAIDRCHHDPLTSAHSSSGYWTLDPVDGTKGFLRGEQYAIALAYIESGEVKLGVLGCPNLDLGQSPGVQLWALKNGGAFVTSLQSNDTQPLTTDDIAEPLQARFCESVEAAHSNHSEAAQVAELLGITQPSVRLDSQAKYAVVASGGASIYLRLPTLAGYEEKIWDHAAGAIIVEEAGGQVSDIHGEALNFAVGRTLRRNRGVVATNGLLHQRVISAVQEVLN
ncbi:MAG TPA: 3'(2'),5'-bisphosphate nucleotidase [Gammaproteobacteria bacterium]|nr:3'(2'),5'-bisphosphate nucleotidase [Gammaproteobacteria bacterium]